MNSFLGSKNQQARIGRLNFNTDKYQKSIFVVSTLSSYLYNLLSLLIQSILVEIVHYSSLKNIWIFLLKRKGKLASKEYKLHVEEIKKAKRGRLLPYQSCFATSQTPSFQPQTNSPSHDPLQICPWQKKANQYNMTFTTNQARKRPFNQKRRL